MASTFTSRLKLERQASGENSGNWGNLVNYVFNRLDSSVRGYIDVDVAGSANVTLTSNNSTSNTDDSSTDDQVHNKVLEFTGALTGDIFVFTDAVEGEYIVFNNTSGSQTLTFAPTGGTGVVLKQGAKTLVYTDGTTMFDITKDLGDIQVTGLISNGAVTITGNTDITGNVNLLTQSEIRFQDTSGGEFIGLKANGTVANSVTFILPVADGTANQVLKTDGSGNLSFTDSSSGLTWQSVQTANLTASAGEAYPINTTSGAITVTLPATPSAGDQVQVVDYAGTFDTNALTIDPNGEDIEGGTDNLLLIGEREGVILTYIDSTQGWIATSGINEGTDALLPTSYSIDFLVIAGGGGGGDPSNDGGNHTYGGGGGGAGGYRLSTQTANIGTAITVTVGDGGAGGASNAGSPAGSGATGSNSSISGTGLTTITSAGGGGGGTEGQFVGDADGKDGGSGGGAGGSNGQNGSVGSGNTPSTAPSQGNNGGLGYQGGANNGSGGGGGGANAVGADATATASTGGNGGAGTASSITGSSVTRAGGGGGGASSTRGTGGTGGGGNGGQIGGAGTAGTVNTGGGGGGGGESAPTFGDGGAGGKGVVILSVPTVRYSSITTGSPTVTTSGSNTIMQFNGDGSYTT
jgi:hypothetical protein